ncbi:hypothetical protein BX616_002819 [Lobosporangium transversale]|nr:hypothetical protein BX616_002819 [Lobosporangium transversale]
MSIQMNQMPLNEEPNGIVESQESRSLPRDHTDAVLRSRSLDYNFGSGTGSSNSSVRVDTSQPQFNIKGKFNTTGIERGNYSVVWTISLVNYDQNIFPTLRFKWKTNKTSIAHIIVSSEDLKDLSEQATKRNPPSNLIRIKTPPFEMNPEIEELEASLERVALVTNARLTGPQGRETYLKVHQIEVYPAMLLLEDAISLTTTIEKWQINGGGTHLATLSYTRNKAYLDLWKLEDTSNFKIASTPCGTTSFDIEQGNNGAAPPLEIAISYNASKLAVFPSGDFDKDAFNDVPPFRVFKYSDKFIPADERPGDRLKFSKTIPSLNQYAGYGKFHRLSDLVIQDADGSHGRDCKDEVFVISYGITVAVYIANGDWPQLHSIQLSYKEDSETGIAVPWGRSETPEEIVTRTKKHAKMLIDTLQGYLCAWVTPREILILDLKMAQVFQHINRDDSAPEEDLVVLSPDGTMLATAFGKHVSIYMTHMDGSIRSSKFENEVTNLSFLGGGRRLLVGLASDFATLTDPWHLTEGGQRLWFPFPKDGRSTIAHIKNLEAAQGHSKYVVQVPTKAIEDQPGETVHASNYETVRSLSGMPIPGPRRATTVSSINNAIESSRDRFKRTVHGFSKGLLRRHTHNHPKEIVQDLIVYRQGPGLNICVLKDSSRRLGPCDVDCRARDILQETFRECTAPSGSKFTLEIESMALEQHEVTALTTPYQFCETVTLRMFDDNGTLKAIQQANHYGVTKPAYRAFFLPCNTRYIVIGEFYIQVWKLLESPESSSDPVCELLAMISIPYHRQQGFGDWLKQQRVSVCRHRNTIHIGDLDESSASSSTFNFSPEALTGQENLEACIQSIPYLIQIYGASDDQSHRREILSFVLKHINGLPDPHNYTNCVIRSIIDAFDVKGYEQFLIELLYFNKDQPTWAPRRRLGENVNLISFIIKKAEGHPKLASTARIVIDYCCWMAKSQKELGYLSLVIEAIPAMIKHEPEIALEAMRKMAFIPVKRHDFVVNRSRVCRPLTIKRLLLIDYFFPQNSLSIYKCKKPVFQLNPFLPSHQTRQEEGVQDNGSFKADVYVTSFDMLWNIESPPIRKLQRRDEKSTPTWKLLLWIALWKAKPKRFKYVRMHDLAPEYFDNPAIEALIENKFASSYWLTRFFFQCIYYVMVLTVSFLQVYAKPSRTEVLLVGIAAMAVVFLWLEMIQCLRDPRRYIKSAYNLVDICVFVLPLSASIVQLATLKRAEDSSNSRLFSFAILAVYWHMLFELRVIQGVCRTVTIILRVARMIKVFFIIFAASILAFAHTFLHLLWAKTIDDEDRTKNAANFPRDFPGALSATYFFMGGRYDPVNDKFGSDDVAFHIIMALYFFTTVILILNVLIALINAAFAAVDSNWYSQWLRNLFQFVGRAENMTYHTPGLRSTCGWFPREIYYIANQQEVEDYYKKHFGDNIVLSTMPTSMAIEMVTKKATDIPATIAASMRTSIAGSNASDASHTSRASLLPSMSKRELRFKNAIERAEMTGSSTTTMSTAGIETSTYTGKEDLSQQLEVMRRDFQEHQTAVEEQNREIMELLQLLQRTK